MWFNYQTQHSNPLHQFLQDSFGAMDIVQVGKVRTQDYPGFVRNCEESNYCADLWDRIRRIAFAYDRLCELTKVHYELSDEQNRRTDSQGIYTFDQEMLRAESRWHVETDLLTFYIYYELKSVADMLEQWGINPADGSELEYCLKARDRFLAHPEFCRVSPRANRGKSIPYKSGFTRCDIASLRQWDSVSQAVYLNLLCMVEPVDREAEVARNSLLIRKGKRNDKLSEHDVTRIKAFGVHEPDLHKAIIELSGLLMDAVMSRITAVCNAAITQYGFVRAPSNLPICRSSTRGAETSSSAG